MRQPIYLFTHTDPIKVDKHKISFLQSFMSVESEFNVAFSFTIIDLPDPIVNCTAYNATAYTMQFSCIPGNDGGIKQSFFVEVIDGYANEALRH